MSPQKLRRGEGEIKDLLKSGFSTTEISQAIDYVVAKYPDTQTLARLPYLLDEALKHQQTATEASSQEQRRTQVDHARKEEERETYLKASAQFAALPVGTQEAWMARAPKWMTLKTSRVS